MAQLSDTWVFIALGRRGLGLAALAGLSDQTTDERTGIVSITASDFLEGALRARPIQRQVDRRAYVELVIESFPVFPFDLVEARYYAELLVQLKSAGPTVPAHVLIIAATTSANGYDILTDNIRDFARVPGLEVRQPRW